MNDRRKFLKGMAAAAAGAPLFPGLSPASPAAPVKGSPKRVIFFLQNQGFDPKTCIPEGMKNSGSLARGKLPEPTEVVGCDSALLGALSNPIQIVGFGRQDTMQDIGLQSISAAW